MQKAKIMLIFIVIVSVFGGLFAFRINKAHMDEFCTLSIIGNKNTWCTSYWVKPHGRHFKKVQFFYAITNNTINCTHYQEVVCTLSAAFDMEQ